MKEPVYIHIDGIRVSRIVAKSISSFLISQAQREGLDEGLQNKLLRCRDLPSNQVSHLEERDDLDFTRATATSQRFFFRNGFVEVTANGITRRPYSSLCDSYVWEHTIVDHDYRDMHQLHDNRGRRRKDLKDFIQLNPHKEDMQRLIDRAQCALFWSKRDDKDGNASYTISAARLNYYLALNGYYTLKDCLLYTSDAADE